MREKQKVWSREETIVAFNLYCKIPFAQTTKSNPLIVQFAEIINRTPSAMSMKIGNLARLDPALKERGISGLTNGSRLDEEIWNEFNDNWDNLSFESEKIIARLQNKSVNDNLVDEPDDIGLIVPEGIDRPANVKARVNQAFFRSVVLSAYDNKCCITGLPVTQLLIASHIVPWSVRIDSRTDPRNGLLLNAVHDKAFDTGLITITTDYKVKVSSVITDFYPNDVIEKWFGDVDGKPIRLPSKFVPSKEYLQWHNENLFKG